MANSINQAGYYKLESFTIHNLDRSKSANLIGLVYEFNILESIDLGSIRGSATIIEAYNIIGKFPIIGEEILEITYRDFFNVKRTEHYSVYAVSAVQYGNENTQATMQYTLSFTSVSKFRSENFRVQKAYNQTTSGGSTIKDFVKDAFNEYYQNPVKALPDLHGGGSISVKSIDVEDTVGNYRLMVPRYTPEMTMHLFAKHGYSTTSKSQTYRFFEARDGFFFATNEYMYVKTGASNVSTGGLPLQPSRPVTSTRPIITFRRNYKGDVSHDRQILAMNDILDIDYGVRVNTIDDIVSGGYKRRIYEIDLLTTNVWSKAYDHTETASELGQKLIHTPRFVDEFMTKEKEMFVVRDYTSTGRAEALAGGARTNQFYSDLYAAKGASMYHMDKNRVNVTVYGRNNLFAGSYVNLNLLEMSYSNGQLAPQEDQDRSGQYIVVSVNSKFVGDTFKQELVVTRAGIGQR